MPDTVKKTKEVPDRVVDGMEFISHGGHPIFLKYIFKEI